MHVTLEKPSSQESGLNSSSTSYFVNLAQATDIDAITVLLQANAPSQGGSLTGEFSRDEVAGMADGPVVGVLFSAAPATAQASVILAMLAAYAASDNAYVYGPVCIAESERGQGLLALLYAAMREQHGGAEAVLFIRRDNPGSLRAHERLGMREVAAFVFDGAQFAVYSDAIVAT